VSADGDIVTPRQMMNDLRYIARVCVEILDGTQVTCESTDGAFKVIVPEDAKPAKEPVKEGDRVAINEKVKPKVWMNTHGTVEAIEDGYAIVKLDAGDRDRVTRATGQPGREKATLRVEFMDKLEGEQ